MSEGTCFSPSWLSPAPEVRHTSCRSGLQAQQWHSHSWLCAFSAQVEAPDLQFILSLEGSGERRFSSAAENAIANTNGFSHGPVSSWSFSSFRRRGNLRLIVRPLRDEISLQFRRAAIHPRPADRSLLTQD